MLHIRKYFQIFTVYMCHLKLRTCNIFKKKTKHIYTDLNETLLTIQLQFSHFLRYNL